MRPPVCQCACTALHCRWCVKLWRLIRLPNEGSAHQLPMTCSTRARPANRGAGTNRTRLCYSPQSCSSHVSDTLGLRYVAADLFLKPDESLLKCIWKQFIFHRKHALCMKLERILNAHNHVHSVVLLSVVWRTALGFCLPPWPTWLFRELSTVSSRLSPVSCVHQGLQTSWSPPPFSPLPQLSLPRQRTQTCTCTKEIRLPPPPPPISQTSLVSASPRPPTSGCSLPFYPSLVSAPLPLPLCPSIAESTGGNSRYMCGWLLCGCHDNRHEFDMALTYPGGCEPGCRASNGAHIYQEWNSGRF